MTDMLKRPATRPKWMAVGRAADFADGEHTCTHVAGKPVVVFHVDGEFLAISNICPHAGLPLGEGERRGMVLTCPFHGYAYHIRTGRNLDWPEDEPPVRTYPTRVVDGTVEIEMEQPVETQHQPNPHREGSSKPGEDPDHPRGPAPQHKPDDEGPGCDPDPGPDREGEDADEPDCPTGYPGQETAPPQQPSTVDPKPKTPPTREGN